MLDIITILVSGYQPIHSITEDTGGVDDLLIINPFLALINGRRLFGMNYYICRN